MLATLAAALLVASPVAPARAKAASAPARAAVAALLSGAPAALGPLEASAAKLQELPLERDGRLQVEAVRRVLGALRALEGAARTALRGEDLAVRLHAHLLVAWAHETTAERIAAAKPPKEASGAAAAAFTDQLEQTSARLWGIAAGQYRSCRDLANAAGAPSPLRQACADGLGRVAPGSKPTPSGAAGAVAAARASELQACADAAGSGTVEVVARLSLDAMGRVEQVELQPVSAERAGLYECVSDTLRLWVFPGLSDAEVELPVRLAARK